MEKEWISGNLEYRNKKKINVKQERDIFLLNIAEMTGWCKNPIITTNWIHTFYLYIAQHKMFSFSSCTVFYQKQAYMHKQTFSINGILQIFKWIAIGAN